MKKYLHLIPPGHPKINNKNICQVSDASLFKHGRSKKVHKTQKDNHWTTFFQGSKQKSTPTQISSAVKIPTKNPRWSERMTSSKAIWRRTPRQFFLRHGCGTHVEENRNGHPGDQGEFQRLSPKLVDLWTRDG